MKKIENVISKVVLLQIFISFLALNISPISYANYINQTTNQKNYTISEKKPKSIVQKRTAKENENNIFSISLYKPFYFLPFYYSTSPYKNIYLNATPNNQAIKPIDAKLQFSFKVPIWKNLFKESSNLYLAYTQTSYWQAYNSSAFFRETNYEPEIFLANNINTAFLPGWRFNFLNIGVTHQSNGKGGALERAWERVYLEGIFSSENCMVSLKPWYPIREATAHIYNPNIAKYLGYGRLLVSYKINNSDQNISLELRNAAESHFKKGAIQIDWSFPLTTHIRGYAQAFSGYGQSLIEYNHYTNSVGIGIALTHWI